MKTPVVTEPTRAETPSINSAGLAFGAGMLSDEDINYFWGRADGLFLEVASEKIEDKIEGFNGIDQFDWATQYSKGVFGSLDLRIYRKSIKRFKTGVLINARSDDMEFTTPAPVSRGDMLVIEPGEAILAETLETVHLSKGFTALVFGRRRYQSRGMMVYPTSPFVNAGHDGIISLMLINKSAARFEIDITEPVCQIVFFKLRHENSEPYSKSSVSMYSKYDESTAMSDAETKVKRRQSWFRRKKSEKRSGLLPGHFVAFFLIYELAKIIIKELFSEPIKNLGEQNFEIPGAVILLFVIIIMLFLVEGYKNKRGEKK